MKNSVILLPSLVIKSNLYEVRFFGKISFLAIHQILRNTTMGNQILYKKRQVFLKLLKSAQFHPKKHYNNYNNKYYITYNLYKSCSMLKNKKKTVSKLFFDFNSTHT